MIRKNRSKNLNSYILSRKVFMKPNRFIVPLAAILVISSSLQAHESDLLSALDNDRYIQANSNEPYIYLENDIIEVMSYIHELKNDNDEVIEELKRRIEDGELYAEYDIVIEALERMHAIFYENYDKIDDSLQALLSHNFETIRRSIEDGSLLTENITRRPARTSVINENIIVRGRSLFEKKMLIKDNTHIHGKLKVCKKALFKKDVKVRGDLKVKGDLTVEGDLEADDALLNDLTVDNLTVNNCIDNLCVDNLSVNDAFINNAQIGSLIFDASVIDEITIGIDITF